MTRWRVILLALLAAVGLTIAACGTGGEVSEPPSRAGAVATQVVPVEGSGSYIDVNAAGLASMLERKDFPLVNVHVPYEREIEGTDIFAPFDQIDTNLDKLPADKGARLVVYCRSGGMSSIAARTLVRLGYTDVWNLDGGMIVWEDAGYPLVNKGR
ncbi:MAG: rhodanese-like domain-containing protein [Anaerolineae bacterium]|nr:rhodanese-like domain-containing protein [Anaerolineae bacterium]NIN97065.1 rhodanese-like domain-containing protein [Anaerolineae bacterium]NIQ80014.1 rhodanese-like domain-containing protein [Anaerolineae bacterium]